MKRDRFEKIAKVAFDEAEQINWKATSWDDETAKLLRREHAGVRRLVKKIQPDGDDGSGFMCGYNEAKNDLLAALDRRAKGGK